MLYALCQWQLLGLTFTSSLHPSITARFPLQYACFSIQFQSQTYAVRMQLRLPTAIKFWHAMPSVTMHKTLQVMLIAVATIYGICDLMLYFYVSGIVRDARLGNIVSCRNSQCGQVIGWVSHNCCADDVMALAYIYVCILGIHATVIWLRFLTWKL